MKTRIYTLALIFLCLTSTTFGQTSWKGTSDTKWTNSANWTAGVPNSTTNAILGDASFTGPNQPTVDANATCNSLTIGGTVATTFTMSKSLVVSGSIVINANGTFSHPGSTLTVKGNWTNNGTYTSTSTSAKTIFGGTAQTINGSSLTAFRATTINAGSTVTLGTNVNITGSGSYLYIYGTVDPGMSPTYTLTSTVKFTIYANGKIKVNASTFAGNYVLSGTVTIGNASIVEYSSTVVNQVVTSAYTYSTLIISGTGTKSLSANLPALNSSNAAYGNIYVNSATFDLGTYTANRSSNSGGQFSLANGAYLKVGGTSNFPANYVTISLALASTVEYNGTAQTVAAQTYGNLIFSSGSGASVKTLPITAFTIQGDFSSNIGAGTSVSYTSGSNITFNGNVTIGASTTFNGNSNTHIIAGNWINNGTFTGNTSTVSFNGASKTITGSGSQNFNNISFLQSGITATGNLNVSGNLLTSGSGQFSHSSGLLTMTGSSKTISGTDIILNDLTVSGSITTTSTFIINSNLSVTGSFSATSGTITMTGVSKTISGAGTIGFSALQLTGTITTSSGFSISLLLDVSGTFSASAGTATFTGTSTLSGTANLYNVTINGTSLQLAAASFLGIANVMTITSGTLNVTTSTPNTVSFNGTGSQNVNAITYHHLMLSNGNTKTAAGAITVNGDLTIGTSTTFASGTYTHSVLRNWINNGTFIPSTGTVQFTGTSNVTITGATTFNILTLNKSLSTTTLSLLNDVTAATVNMTSGKMLTGSNKITITTTRTGNGIILGTITRTHAFGTGTAYAFEGPDNTIIFSSATAVTSITVTVTSTNIADFPDGASVNREYNVTLTGTSYNATLRLHYEDAELNGNNESNIVLWNNPGTWTSVGKSSNNTTSNYVEKSGLTNINSRWSFGESPLIVQWNGSVSNNWNTAANWTVISGSASAPPAVNDIVEIGTAAFTNQPVISTAVNVKGITFGSVQAATLTIAAGGSLTTSGNIGGTWVSDAVHTINTGNQSMTVNGNLTMSTGISNRSVNFSIGTGTVSVAGSLIQKGNASVVFSGSGSLNIGTDYTYSSGTFTAGTGTVIYNGTGGQTVANVPYNNLTINKTAGNATLNSTVTLTGNLSILAGTLDVNLITINVNGNVAISSGATLNCDAVNINTAGNWTNSGTYLFSSGNVTMNGAGAQSISTGSFNNLFINKSSGTATLTGNNTLYGNLSVVSGTLDLSTFTINRQSTGGSLSLSAGSTLFVGGANNFPLNYSVYNLDISSTVHYNGIIAQTVKGTSYGNLSFSNGAVNTKTQSANTTVSGDLLINNGATFHSGGFSTVLSGNWTNNGTFTPATGTVILNGAAKTVTGNTTFNNVTVNGSYTVAGSDINYNSTLVINTGASYESGSGVANVNGDLTNYGTLTSNGTTNFAGNVLQTIRLLNAIVSTSTGIINFNGTVAPILNSTSTPQFATLNINNTAGINPSVDWTVFVAMNVNTGGIFNGGLLTHTIYGSFANTGTVTSSGTLNFTASSAKSIDFGSSGFSSTGIVNFGGTGQITMTGTPGSLGSVIISNTNSAGVSPSSNWQIGSNFSINQYAIFNAGAYTYTIDGNINSDGVLNGGTSTFIMTGSTAELSVSAETVFNHFTIANSAVLTPATDYRVSGNFTNNGTYDGSTGLLIMVGSNSATIGGATIPTPIAQLSIEKTSGATVTQNVNISNLLFLNISSGVLFTSTYTVSQDAGGGILIISNGATLRLGGTNSLPGFSGYGLDVNSNVDYAGTTQTVGNAATYGNLLISAAGNKNAFVPFVVSGNLLISAGTLATSTVTVSHSVAGNFIMSGGTLSGTSSTYILNGTADQALTLLSNLVNLTVNKASGNVVLGSTSTVNATLNLNTGKIVAGNYNLIIGNSGSIINANSSSYIIATGTGTLKQQVVAGGSKSFPVGTSTAYTPASVTLTGGSTTDIFNVRMLTALYSGGTTGSTINSNTLSCSWLISETTNGGSDATISLQWPASIELPGFNRALSRVAHYTTGAWDYGLTDINATGTNPYSVLRSGFTGFSPFAVSMYMAVLPVLWIDIHGRNEQENNHISWSLTSDIQTNYFSVEASTDGNNFSEAGKILPDVQDHGKSLKYNFIHNDIKGKALYYRIKQVDIDSNIIYSKTIRIIPMPMGGLKVYPNPVKTNTTFSFNLSSSSVVLIIITDMNGKKMYSNQSRYSKGGNYIQLDMSSYTPGIYNLTMCDETGTKKTVQLFKTRDQ